MRRKRIAGIICGLLLVLTIIDYRMAIACLGEPFIIPTVAYMVADEYCNAIDVPYHYMGSQMLDTEHVAGAEWMGIFVADYYSKQWAFVIDNQEEFEEKYAAYGVDESYVKEFNYTENILVLSINRQINQIYALETDVIWQNDIPYIEPDFSYKNKIENNMIYYYEVPRMKVQFEGEDEAKITNLHLSNPDYSEKKTRHVNVFPFFNKWGWAFDKFNYGV